MSRKHEPRETVFAIVRYEPDVPDLEHCVTIKEVVWSEDLAEAEVTRLNELNAEKGCIYFWQMTRLFPPGTSAGSEQPA